MKTTLFLILACLVMSSFTYEDQTAITILLHKVDSLEKRIKTLEADKEKLTKIASRWEYGKDSYLYENDYYGGNHMSPRYLLSLDQLKFEEDSFDKKLVQDSEASPYEFSANCIGDFCYYDESGYYKYDENIVNTHFEKDRYNYFLAVVMVNAMTVLVDKAAHEAVNDSDIDAGYALYRDLKDICKGLLYRKLYNEYGGDYRKATKDYIEILKYILEY